VCLGALWVPYRRDSAVMKAALAAATHGDNSVHHVSLCMYVCMYACMDKSVCMCYGELASEHTHTYILTYIHTIHRVIRINTQT
jgi:hypothetical protein